MSSTPPGPAPAPLKVTRHYILGTAGHIDHGKTSLVHALTGTDTDRLPEERRRGMTIELGFAALDVGNVRFGIVDVPGHERFVRTMVAGATGIDIALIVVAADDSVMPQTVEHVEVLQLLGVHRGVVAVTKTDMVDAEMVELVCDDIRRLLAGTPLEAAPICPVSSTTGAGIEELKQEILKVSQGVESRTAKTPFRMAVDRVFTVQGRGTVVTGSALRGEISEGDTLDVWPVRETCRVRGLQSHGISSRSLVRGQRAAINISGIGRDRLQRGSELATPGYLEPSRMLDARLRCLSSSARPIKSSSIVRLEIGTTEVPVRVVLLDTGSLAPGESAYGQLRAADPLTATYGQRFILRDENATRTIGGGVVLRPVTRRRRRDPEAELKSLRRLDTGNAADRVEEVLYSAGFTTPTHLQLCSRAGVGLVELPDVLEELRAQHRWVPVAGTEAHAVPAAVDDLAGRLVGWLERYHRTHPELPGRAVDSVLGWLERVTTRSIARPLLDSFIDKGILKSVGRFACVPAFAPSLSATDEKLMAEMIDAIRKGGFQPPSLEESSATLASDRKRRERLATLATALGELVQVDPKIHLHADVERQLREKVAELVARQKRVTVADVRQALESSRKYVVPFLEYLDRVGFTKRIGDHRVLTEQDNE